MTRYFITALCIVGAVLLFLQARKEKQKGNIYAMVAFIILGMVVIGAVIFVYWFTGILLSFFGLM
jgi:hypothetical protein